MADPGERERLTAGAAGIMLLLGIALLTLTLLILASAGTSGTVGTLAIFVFGLAVIETGIASMLLARHLGALRDLLRGVNERRLHR